MTDIALSILALIAGGLTLELFTFSPLSETEKEKSVAAVYPLDEAAIGNPS